MRELTVTRMSDGKKFVCEFDDRGDTCFAHGIDGIPYKVYLSHFKIKGTDIEFYSEVDKITADKNGDVERSRLEQDEKCFEFQGLVPDWDSLK